MEGLDVISSMLARDIFDLTLEHLYLVGVSMGIAAMLAIPLGILMCVLFVVVAPVSWSCLKRTSLMRDPGSSSLSAKSSPPPAPQQYGFSRFLTGSFTSAPNLVNKSRGSSTFPPYRAR